MSYILRLFPWSYGKAEEDFKVRQERAEKLKRLEHYEKAMIPALVKENEDLKKQVEALQKVAESVQHPQF